MKNVYFSLVVIFLWGCNKEQSTYTEAYAVNTTNHQIKIVGLTKGAVLPGDSIDLKPGEKITLGIGLRRGKYAPGFVSDYFNIADSLIVTFDNQFKVIHYGPTPAIQSSKSYINTSDRNFLNPISYLKDATEKKNGASIIYTYEFTEADYQFAL